MAKDSFKQPRISLNKLAEFIQAKAPRQRQILRDQKFPQDYKVMYYREAAEAISLCLSSNLENTSVLDKAIASLEQQTPEKIGTQRRIEANIDALEAFQTMLDDIDFKDATPQLGDHSPPKLTVHNVEISIRPDIILTATGKKGAQLVGAVKLHFPKTFPLGEDGGAFASALLQEYGKAYLHNHGEAHGPMCYVIDVGSRKVWPGVKSVVNRMKEIQANCQNITALWPTITPGD